MDHLLTWTTMDIIAGQTDGEKERVYMMRCFHVISIAVEKDKE